MGHSQRAESAITKGVSSPGVVKLLMNEESERVLQTREEEQVEKVRHSQPAQAAEVYQD